MKTTTWSNRVQETGIYKLSTNEAQSLAGNMYLPYDTVGNINDLWAIISTKIDNNYTVIQCFQYNAITENKTRRFGSGIIHFDGSQSPQIYWYNRDEGVSY